MNGLSIIITTYKRNHSLKLLIKDLEKQILEFPLEIIIVNNNKKDIKIKSNLKIKIINNKNKNGCSQRYKLAESLAKYKTIIFLDDDVHIIDRRFVSEFKNFHHKKSRVDIASSWCSSFDSNNLDYFSAKPINFNNFDSEKEVDLIGPGISIFNKNILTEKVTNIPKKFRLADNVWFSLQTSIIHKTKKYYFPSKNKIEFRRSYLSVFAMYRSKKVKEQKEKSINYFLQNKYVPIFLRNIKKIKTPIILIAYNRPKILEKNLKLIKNLKLSKIYVLCDGPKDKNDKIKTDKVRKLIKKYLDSNITTKLYSKKNIGLRNRVVSGLNEVFKKEKMAIILEDDCIPNISFFKFSEELLKKYKDNRKIGSISGTNYLLNKRLVKSDYYFSEFPHSWGWATWRRSWNLYDNNIDNWEIIWRNHEFNSAIAKYYWYIIFSAVSKIKIDSWAYRWTYSCWKHNLLTIIPSKNLVTNIGVGNNSSNTKFKSSVLNMKTESIEFPLKHPKIIKINKKLDAVTEKNLYIKPKVIAGAILKLIK